MARKSKKFGIAQILACVAIVLGVVALIMLFVPQLNYVSKTGYDSHDPLTGLHITFGYEDKLLKLNFSFGNFIKYILVLIGIAFAVLAMLGKLGKIAPIVAAATFVVAGILFFIALPMTAVDVGKLTGDAATKAVEAFRDSYSLGAGAIVGGILSILAGGAAITGLFIKK